MRRRELGQIEDPALIAALAAQIREREAFSVTAVALLEEVIRLGALLELAAGEALIREGDASTADVYLLVEGALRVQSGGTFIARLDRPGDVVGEVAVLMASRRTADVLAESTVRAVALPSGVIQRPEFAEIAAGIRRAMLRDDWAEY